MDTQKPNDRLKPDHFTAWGDRFLDGAYGQLATAPGGSKHRPTGENACGNESDPAINAIRMARLAAKANAT